MSDDKKHTPAVPSADALAAAVKLVSEQMIPAAVAAAVAATTKQAAPAQAPRPANYVPVKCHECGQQVTACEGKHTQMVVYPTQYPQHAPWFAGAIINGVRYLSNDSGHLVTVPASAAGAISQLVAGYERNEQDMTIGRQAEHHSGVISVRGASVNAPTKAWR